MTQRVARIVLRKKTAWWAVVLVLPFVVCLWRYATFAVHVTYDPSCIDNCERVDAREVAEKKERASDLQLAFWLALGAAIAFAASLRPRTVVTIDRNEGVIRVAGRGLAERVSFEDSPSLIIDDQCLLLTTREHPPIFLTHWPTSHATVDRLRLALHGSGSEERGAYRTHARERVPDVRIVLRKMPRFWVALLVAPLVISSWLYSSFHVRWVFIDHGPMCDIDNCSDPGGPDPDDVMHRKVLGVAVQVTLILAIGATLAFAMGLEGPRTVVVIDRNERVVRVSGRKLSERVPFADAPALVVHDRRLILEARERQPIVLTRWHTRLASIDRLRAELDDVTA